MCARRNDDFAGIVGGCHFDEKVECVQAFHHLVWMGDLNYRCEFGVSDRKAGTRLIETRPRRACGRRRGARGRVRQASAVAVFRDGSAHRREEARGRLPRVRGGKPARAHMPTFKVQRERGFKYKEQRTPAWCDRVLWRTAEDSSPSRRCSPRETSARAITNPSPRRWSSNSSRTPPSCTSKMTSKVRIRLDARDRRLSTRPPWTSPSTLRNRRRGRGPRTRRRKRRVRVARALGLARVHEDGVFVPERQGAQVAPPETLSALEVLSVVFRAGSIRPDAILRVAVTILDAPRSQLIASDFGRSSDPYVVFFGPTLGPPPAGKPGRPSRWRTETITSDLNPAWRCDKQVPRLPLVVSDPAILGREHLAFRVMDEDTLTKDDPIGYGRLWLGPLAGAMAEGEPWTHDHVVPLTPGVGERASCTSPSRWRRFRATRRRKPG